MNSYPFLRNFPKLCSYTFRFEDEEDDDALKINILPFDRWIMSKRKQSKVALGIKLIYIQVLANMLAD